MHTLSIVFKVLLALFATTIVVQAVYVERRNLRFIATIWARFRVRMFFEVSGVIIQTVLIYSMLSSCGPLFKYGWTSLFLNKSGNVLVAPITEATDSSIAPIRLFPFLFFLLFLIAIPFLARFEENMFRKGKNEWSDISKQSIVFGLIHCLAGVSLAAGIALIGTGFFYAYKYRKAFLKELATHGDIERAEEEAVLVSTTYHTLYNSVLVIFLIAVLAIKVLY